MRRILVFTLITLFFTTFNLTAAQAQPEYGLKCSNCHEDSPNRGNEVKELKILGLSPSKKGPQALGSKIRWTVRAEGEQLQYSWEIFKGNTKVLKIPFSGKNNLEWTPKVAGFYKVKVVVKDQSGKTISKTSSSLELKESKIVKITPSKPSGLKVGTKVEWTVKAEGVNLQYSFEVYKEGKKIRTTKYSTSKIYKWSPKETGSYKIIVKLKDGSGKVISMNSGKYVVKK